MAKEITSEEFISWVRGLPVRLVDTRSTIYCHIYEDHFCIPEPFDGKTFYIGGCHGDKLTQTHPDNEKWQKH